MKLRALGKTGINVSEVGFGAWGIGGTANGAIAYGPVDRSESILALQYAFDYGITFFDTSDFYGFGESEEVIGEAFSGLRSKVIIASKVGMVTDESNQNFEANYIRSTLEQSLVRLQTDYIDLYQLHSPPARVLSHHDPAITILEKLKRDGKIRAWGISARSPADASTAISVGAEVVQINFNLVDQRARSMGIFEKAEKAECGVIVRTPLSFGFLTGRYSANQKYDERDHRSKWSPEQRVRWAEAYRLFQALLALQPEQTPAQFALRFCLSFPEVSTIIPGMLTRKHVGENVGASSLGPLTPEALEIAHSIYESNEFFVRS